VASTFFIHTAFAAVSEGCGLWDVRLECDLSGWMKLFLGDEGIGIEAIQPPGEPLIPSIILTMIQM